MLERVELLARAMGAGEDEDLLTPLCQLAVERLERRLRPGVRREDCGEAFPVAAALLVLDLMEGQAGGQDVESFSAGDLSVKLGGRPGRRADQARRLMAPFCPEEGFAFRGVRG